MKKLISNIFLYGFLPLFLAFTSFEIYAYLFPQEFPRYGWQTNNIFFDKANECSKNRGSRNVVVVVGDSHVEYHGNSKDNLVNLLNQINKDKNVFYCNFSLSGQGMDFYRTRLSQIKDLSFVGSIKKVFFVYSEANDFSGYILPYEGEQHGPSFDRRLSVIQNLIKETVGINFIWRHIKTNFLPSRFNSLEDWVNIKNRFPWATNSAQEAFLRYQKNISEDNKRLFTGDNLNAAWLEVAMLRPQYMRDNFGYDSDLFDKQLKSSQTYLNDIVKECRAQGIICEHYVVPMSYYLSENLRISWVKTFGFDDCIDCKGPIKVIKKLNDMANSANLLKYPSGLLEEDDFFNFDDHLRGVGNRKIADWILKQQ